MGSPHPRCQVPTQIDRERIPYGISLSSVGPPLDNGMTPADRFDTSSV